MAYADMLVLDLRRCHCGQGLPCTCAAKRDIDVDDLPKAAARNLTHRRVQSHGAKPVMPNRRSDSVVPRHQLSLHPPLPRVSNAAQDLGTPYNTKRFTTSSPNVSILAQRSEDNLQLGSQGLSPQLSIQAPELSSSVPTSHWDPPRSNVNPTPPNFSSADFLQPRVDTSFIDNALSPGNPSRYSMNDFSKFSWPDFGGNQLYGQPDFAMSADQLGTSNYSDWGLDTPSYSHGNTAIQTPQRLSVASVEQPGLTHSPSNTISEAGSSAYPSDTTYANYAPQQPTTINPSFTSKDYFGPQGLGTVSENMGDTPNDSFVYRMESSTSMDDIFGAGPGPAEPAIKSEPMDYGMNDTLVATDTLSSTEPGPSLVVPEFTNFANTSGPFGTLVGPATSGQEQQQQPTPFYDETMAGSYNWEVPRQ